MATGTKKGWNALDYAGSSAAQQSWAEEMISALSLTGSEHILDLGCGDGKITKQIADCVPDGLVIGIDLSKDMIQLARSRHEEDNLSFHVMDASHIKFNHLFDLIFSNAALHWVEDHLPILTGIQSHLKPGGKTVLQMGGLGNAEDMLDVISHLVASKRWLKYFEQFQTPYFFYDTEPYAKWLKQAGLIADKIELFPKGMTHSDREGLKSWLRTTWFPYTDRLPVDLRDPFLEEALSSYLEKFPPDAKGQTHVAMVRLQVEARKPAVSI